MKVLSGPLALVIVAAAIAVSLLREPLPAQEAQERWEYNVDQIVHVSDQAIEMSLQNAANEGWQFVETVSARIVPDGPDAVFCIFRRPLR